MIKLTGVKYTEGLLLARYIYAACTGTNDSFCFSGAFQSPFHEIKSLKRFSLSLSLFFAGTAAFFHSTLGTLRVRRIRMRLPELCFFGSFANIASSGTFSNCPGAHWSAGCDIHIF